MKMSMNNILCCAATIAIISIYLNTISPSIAGGDSGELVAEGCILGTAHPPGYPVFTLIARLGKLLATSFAPRAHSNLTFSVANIMNLTSVIFTSIASFLISKIVIMCSKGNYVSGSLFSMGMFAFSPLIWQYAVTAEVFPLNTMFAALICYQTLHFSQTRNISIAVLGAFFCGLSLCNQHTIVLFEAPLIIWMLFLLRYVLMNQPIYIAILGFSFILGLSPYFYLPLAANYNPQPGSWGDVGTWDGFFHHFLRRDYGTRKIFSVLSPSFFNLYFSIKLF